jgi:pSer/pThr/pTyr-binding forkhead associated (FHA) protein
MPAQLVALDEGPSILLDKPILLIGRHPECDIQIDSRKISRRHCCIAQVHDYLVVRDLGSTNGVRINGDRVEEGRLDDGDEVTIGANRFRVALDGTPATPKRAAQPSEAIDPDEDDLLEASEVPIPLSEPGKPAAPPRSPVPNSPRAKDSSPPILPEVLEIAPSDVFPLPPDSHPPL